MVFGRLLGLYAVLLQIAVFLQPLLPEKYQISPVCETIAQALQLPHSVASLVTIIIVHHSSRTACLITCNMQHTLPHLTLQQATITMMQDISASTVWYTAMLYPYLTLI